MLPVVLSALVLLGAPISVEPGQYELTVTVVEAGVETVSARAVIYEDYDASVIVRDSVGVFEMNASLVPVQGDGDDQLSLQVSMSDGGDQTFEPSLTIKRGGEAQLVIGTKGPNGEIFDGIELTLRPAPLTD